MDYRQACIFGANQGTGLLNGKIKHAWFVVALSLIVGYYKMQKHMLHLAVSYDAVAEISSYNNV